MSKEAIIIDGKKIANEILDELKTKIIVDHKGGAPVTLAIILVGNDVASSIYVKNKIHAASKVGIKTRLRKFETGISENELIEYINYLNEDSKVSGIIVQLPLPRNINKTKIVNSIKPSKDVDGFNPINAGLLYSPYKHKFVPCTAKACLDLIRYSCSNLSGKHSVVIGRSNIVGRPLAALLLKEDCSVTICHSKTINLQSITYQADIIISAVGNPGFLTEDYFNKDAIVIDVGINRVASYGKYKLIGDVDFDNVKKKVKYITPVPGGVGPMTVAHLLINTYVAKVSSK